MAAGRSRWTATLVAVAVVLGWLIIGGVAGPYSGKLGEVSTNDNASFLPADAEATRAQDLAAGFVDRETTPALVVYERAGGLTPADQQRIQADAARFADVPGVVGPLPPPIVSQDRQAAQVIVPIESGEGEQIRAVVERLRDIAGPDRDGLTVDVAGPAGLLGDLIEVFGAIDGPLLLVTLTVVLVILLVVYRSPVLWIFPLLAAGMSYSLAAVFVYLLADHDIVKLNGQAQGILTVLVFGAGTDYALLLIARYREELHRHERPWDAMTDRLEGRRAGHRRLRRHSHRQPALPAAVQPQLQPGARPGERRRHRRHAAGDAHVPARAAGPRRQVGVLAPAAPARRGRPARRARHLGADRRLRGAPLAYRLGRHRRRRSPCSRSG